MNITYQLTDSKNYQSIQDLLDVYLQTYLATYNEPITVTVYEHLNVVNVYYDEGNSITCSSSNTLRYPIAVNDQITELIYISSDYSSSSGSLILSEDKLIVNYIDNQIPFVIAITPPSLIELINFTTVIRSDKIAEITAPVIVKKAYPQLLKEAEKMNAY